MLRSKRSADFTFAPDFESEHSQETTDIRYKCGCKITQIKNQMSRFFIIILMSCAVLSSCRQDEELQVPTTAQQGIVVKLRYDAYRGETRSALRQTADYDRVEYCVVDGAGSVVGNVKGVYDTDSSELKIEGLHEGDYRLLLLGIRGDWRNDGIDVRKMVHIEDTWITFPDEILKPLGAEYFYSQTPFTVTARNTGSGNEQTTDLPAEIIQNRIVGRTDFSFVFNNTYVRTAVLSKSALLTRARFYTGLTGTGSFVGESASACLSLDLNVAASCIFLPTVDGSAFTGESPYTIVGDRKIHLYERSADNGFTEITGYDDCFTGCGKMADYTYIPISWGGISDGTTGVPVLELSMVPSEGEEYFRFDISIKGADVKSCRYVLGETETVQSRLEEMGDYEKLCNRYGTAFSSSVIGNINSPEGHTVSSSDNLEPATEYTLVVMAGNVHGNTVETCVAVTGDVPEGEAGYERYIGTWTVTSASSEITGKPQTFTVEIEPYRVNESFRVSGWGITGFGSRDIAPFLMDYSDGNVSVSTYGYYGMYNLYYVYLKYRFKKEDGLYYVWTTDEDLATGTFGDDGTVTIEMSGFTDPASGNTYQVSGMDYFLYSGGKFYEVENMFKPGYTVSDYSIGPYVLTKSGPEQTRARKAASASPAFVELETVSLPVIPVRQGASEVLR